jgi:hypothetical protein
MKPEELGRPDRCSPVAVAARKRACGGWPCNDQDPDLDLLRCGCPECRTLDFRHPREGYQLTLL